MRNYIWLLMLGVFYLISPGIPAETTGAKTSALAPAQSVYSCHKIDEKINVDGRLDENIWQTAPSMNFVDIVMGTQAFYRTEGRMVWDDNYLYVGFDFEEPDIRGYWAMTEPYLPEGFSIDERHGAGQFHTPECQIMRIDRFAKVFLDPDGDGSNYLEFQINPLNTVFDSWYKQGSSEEPTGTRNQFPHVAWKCPGLLSATHIYGSINNPSDIDKGWSLEIAIPWSAMKPFVYENCPPKNGDIWGGHLGRVFRDRIGGINTYWVWPYIGVENCHLPDRYGKIMFEDSLPSFDRFFAWGVKTPYDTFIQKAADIGVTDILFWNNATPELVDLCAKYKINIYNGVTLDQSGWKSKYPDKPAPVQKISADEEKNLALLKGELYQEDAPMENPKLSAEPENWRVTPLQKKMIETAGRENVKIQNAYQWGGEPEKKHKYGGWNKEVLVGSVMLCFHNPEVRELTKEAVKLALAVSGVKGVVFDSIGYANYHCCYCDASMKLYKEYCAKNKLAEDKQSLDQFALETLVNFQNEMVDCAKSIRADAVTVNHVYPVFLPEPLYGNRLKVDYCGQTAAWYFFWDPFRIANYARVITAEQNKYWPSVKGVVFIGYFDRPGTFPLKSPEKVELELRAILRGGAKNIMTCSLTDLLNNPDIAEIFKKFCGKRKSKNRGK